MLEKLVATPLGQILTMLLVFELENDLNIGPSKKISSKARGKASLETERLVSFYP